MVHLMHTMLAYYNRPTVAAYYVTSQQWWGSFHATEIEAEAAENQAEARRSENYKCIKLIAWGYTQTEHV